MVDISKIAKDLKVLIQKPEAKSTDSKDKGMAKLEADLAEALAGKKDSHDGVMDSFKMTTTKKKPTAPQNNENTVSPNNTDKPNNTKNNESTDSPKKTDKPKNINNNESTDTPKRTGNTIKPKRD